MDSDDTKLYVLAIIKLSDEAIQTQIPRLRRSLDYRDTVAICSTKAEIYHIMHEYRVDAKGKFYKNVFYVFAISKSQRSKYERP